MKDQKKAEEIAVQRVQLLSPLLASGLDSAKVSQIKAEICAQHGMSERTLRRYLAQYRTEQFEGLKPKPRGRKPSTDTIKAELLEEAILLRREVPGRSVRQIIQILVWEGRAKPGEIKRSTLQDRLTARGYSSRQMRMYTTPGAAARRFQKRHRNALWQSDIKFGPHLPIGAGGEKKPVYLVLFIDDATRFVVHGAFYDSLEQSIVEDCFRQAIAKYGVPEAVYFDNGKQYRTKWMNRTCAKLGIRLLFARPYAPESKGKIERLNGVVGSFLNELALEKVTSLEQLNTWFQVWLSECHQNKLHSALGDDQTPEIAYRSDTKALRLVDADLLASAFLHSVDRKVDKAGCISFDGKKYEVGLLFIGRTVQVVYDPADVREVTIEYEGHSPWTAREMVIGERSGKRPTLPDHLGIESADISRLLRGAEQEHANRKVLQAPAVSYRSIRKEDSDHV
ncbi:DDE-type integrase/transposase/recombinase [Cohnella fermenti]|uniref:Transposase n=1 Tax=Cohnella fermenti TaxID=2565925 RepID=A0A4V3WDL0_9BACL|nr:DDE-type integrase/transposase/recombinase [Cohnella fermenti]THF72458.1 transposase [Cohnella fermenti]